MSHPGLLVSENPGLNTLKSQLAHKAEAFSTPAFHLRQLLKARGRFEDFSLVHGDFSLDYSRQRMDSQAKALLFELARALNVLDRFRGMTQGDVVNPTENRPALHTAARGSGKRPIRLEGMDIPKEMDRVRDEIQEFSRAVHAGKICGTRGRPFTHGVVVGIGGSYLGCEFAYEAMNLSPSLGNEKKLALSFLANVDIDNFARVTREIDPETTLWIVVSKSYTTTETMANLNQVLSFLKEKGLSPQDHIVTVTAQGSPGDDPANPVLAAFHMFDFIGGRYSVSSAVGGVPLSLAFGYEGFRRFLQGCRSMDDHVLNAPPEQNIPLTAALISLWNTLFLNYPAQAIIPYATGLSKLAPHVQQLYMESIGKSVSSQGRALTRPAGAIIFGEPGTNAQHSFFQLAHQGPAFPIEFIGVAAPGYSGHQALSKGVTNHQELWANLLAQSRALALGRDHEDPARRFGGNRPSSIITMADLEPENIGRILAFYEARTVLEGFLLGINPFDQFGVELGKTMALDFRTEIAARNRNPGHAFTHLDKSEQFYLNRLFKA